MKHFEKNHHQYQWIFGIQITKSPWDKGFFIHLGPYSFGWFDLVKKEAK